MNRNRSVVLTMLVCLVLLCTNAAANSDSSVTTELQNYQQQQLAMLNQLHQAGLISDALYQRRKSVLVGLASLSHVPDITSSDQNDHFVALVVGSNNYKHYESLDSAVNDARAVSEILTVKFGFDVLLLENPDRHELISTLATLRQTLSANDNFLLYYAGHGYLDPVSQRGYWLPTDAEQDNPSNWISTTEISDALMTLPSRRALVIADSCFSGSLADSSLRPAPLRVTTRDSRSSNSRSRTVITSGGLEPVLDSIDGKHSVFTRALLDQLNLYDENSSISDLFENVANRVTREAEQTPGYFVIQRAGHHSGEFLLKPVENR